MSAEPERPSARAVERLAMGVGEDVTDLRTQLHRALDEAERLQAAGRGDLAVTVLQEQHDALLVVHQRLEARLADAAVEREAERVVDRAAPALDEPHPAPAPTVSVGDDGMALRLAASAAAAVLGVALLLSPELGSGRLSAAGSAAASDAPQDTSSSRSGDAAGDLGTTPSTPAERDALAAERVTDLQALALPDADRLSTRALDDEDEEADAADIGGLVSVPGVGPIDSLVPGTPDLSTAEDDGHDGDAGERAGDDGAAADGGAAGDETADHDSAGQDAGGDDTTGDEPEQDGAADDGGTDGSTSQDDGSTRGDQTEPDGGGDTGGADGEDPSGGLDLGETGGEPTSLER